MTRMLGLGLESAFGPKKCCYWFATIGAYCSQLLWSPQHSPRLRAISLEMATLLGSPSPFRAGRRSLGFVGVGRTLVRIMTSGVYGNAGIDYAADFSTH